MFSLLESFRAREAAPERLLAGLPGSRIWYLDDTGSHDPALASWAESLDPATARRRQAEGCGVFCTLRAFAPPPAVGEVGPVLALGVDVSLAAHGERRPLPQVEMDVRKQWYLCCRLLPFRLRPHWLIETRCGFQVVFRIAPGEGETDDEALYLCRSLTGALLGDEDACGLVQHVRVPGWAQLEVPDSPFRCRLLVDRTMKAGPYRLAEIRQAIEQGPGQRAKLQPAQRSPEGPWSPSTTT